MSNVISREEYERLRSKTKAYESARKTFDPKRYLKGGGYTPADVAAIEKMAGGKDATNEEKTKVEVYEFINDPPQKYFAYYNKELTEIRTWMGDKLGTIVSRGGEYKSPLGDKRVNVKIEGINGVLYSGTCFLSAGDYCRMRAVKSSRLNPLTRQETIEVEHEARRARIKGEQLESPGSRGYHIGRSEGMMGVTRKYGTFPRRNPLLMTVMGNPGPDYQDILTAAQRVGYTMADAASIATEFRKTGRIPRLVQAQLASPLRYNCNPEACENPRHGHNPRGRTPYTHARALLKEFVTSLEEGGPEYSSDYASDFADRARIAIRRKVGSSPQELAFLKEFVKHEWNPDYFEDFAFRVSHFLGLRENPQGPRSRFVHERIASASGFQPSSFRTIQRGGHHIIIGRPRGSTKTRAQAILHPAENAKRPAFTGRGYNFFVHVPEGRANSVIEMFNKAGVLFYTQKGQGRKETDFYVFSRDLDLAVDLFKSHRRVKGNPSKGKSWSYNDGYHAGVAFAKKHPKSIRPMTSYAQVATLALKIAKRLGFGFPSYASEDTFAKAFLAGYIDTVQTVKRNPGNLASNPESGRRRKVTMNLDAFARMVKAKNDPKLWRDFVAKVNAYRKWTHGTLPKKVTVETVNAPGMNGLWITYDGGKAPETTYVMPRGSKRKGAWVHEWETMPDLKNDPKAGIMLTKLRGKSRITDFLHR